MPKVIVLGGGVAGMSAAHELVERGFEVEVYDQHSQYVGGKARSVDVPDTGTGNENSYLPGEHGFRFFPGFYKHITDTMKRIPFTRPDGHVNSNGCYDNLVPTKRVMIARNGKLPIVTDAEFPKNIQDVELLIHDIFGGVDTGLTHEELNFFAGKVWQLMTSSGERRLNNYEKIGWWQFMEADNFSETYRHLLVEGLTRTLVAAQAKRASTKTGGDIFLQLIFNMLDPVEQTDRVLNGPTNEKWLNPWLQYLAKRNVAYNFEHAVVKLNVSAKGHIESVDLKQTNGNIKTVTGDYYILAVPIECVVPLLTDDVIKYDSTFSQLITLSSNVQWMNGIQFYLNVDIPINRGHIIFPDSQWAITAISQVQFWTDYDIKTKHNGKVRGIVSCDVSDWFTPGPVFGKQASECSPDEIKTEVWQQLKNGLNVGGQTILSDDMLEHWYLDHDIVPGADPEKMVNKNKEPLLVNRVNTWSLRPPAYTNIDNLFLAGDYVRTFTDLATMEGANESARRAVNCIIDKSGSNASFCKIWDLHEPEILAPFRAYDEHRRRLGLPWKAPLAVEVEAFRRASSKIESGFKNILADIKEVL